MDNPNLYWAIGSGVVVLIGLIWLAVVIYRKVKHRLRGFRFARAMRLMVGPLLALVVSIATIILIRFAKDEWEWIEKVDFIGTLLFVGSMAWLFIQLLAVIKLTILDQYDFARKDNLEARKVYTQFDILENILVGLVVLIALAIALMTFPSIRRIGVSLFASAGVAGIIIGLAAQKLIGTYLAGLQIAITQPIRIDDVVVVEGEWGRIEDINLTYVVVRIWDKRRLVLPTTYFIEKPFQNWTRVSADILGSVYVYADYTFPIQELRDFVEKTVPENEWWDGQVVNVQVTNNTEDTIEIRSLVSAADGSTAWDLRVWLREKIVQFIADNYEHHLPKARVSLDSEKPTS